MLLTPREIKEQDQRRAEFQAAYQRLVEAIENNTVLSLDDETLRVLQEAFAYEPADRF